MMKILDVLAISADSVRARLACSNASGDGDLPRCRSNRPITREISRRASHASTMMRTISMPVLAGETPGRMLAIRIQFQKVTIAEYQTAPARLRRRWQDEKNDPAGLHRLPAPGWRSALPIRAGGDRRAAG